MAKGIFLEGVEREQLRAYFDNIEKRIKELREQMQPKEPTKFLSRKEVAATFGVTLPTVHDWTKKGLLKSYRMGNRILYKRSEVEAAITPTWS
jgi:excisionase family DNA binding protein